MQRGRVGAREHPVAIDRIDDDHLHVPANSPPNEVIDRIAGLGRDRGLIPRIDLDGDDIVDIVPEFHLLRDIKSK